MRRALIPLIAAALLAGCASPAHREGMLPQPPAVAKRHAATVSVQTRGGSDTGIVDSSNISDADFKAALETAIARSGVFRAVSAGTGGDYGLAVAITHLSKPLVGFDATVDLETAWVLTKTSTRATLMRKVVRSSFTVTSAQAMVGVTRLRLAVEGAARENIRQGVEALGALDLP